MSVKTGQAQSPPPKQSQGGFSLPRIGRILGSMTQWDQSCGRTPASASTIVDSLRAAGGQPSGGITAVGRRQRRRTRARGHNREQERGAVWRSLASIFHVGAEQTGAR